MLVLAKAITLPGHALPLSIWSPFAWFWQDVLVALVVGGVDYVIGRPVVGWTMYACVGGYTAVNVPVALVLSSPLTPMLLRAAGGPLADSIDASLTPRTIGSLVICGVSVIAWPWLLRRLAIRPGAISIAIAAAVVSIGPVAARHVETSGFDRNALTALWWVRPPAAGVGESGVDWRASLSPGRGHAGVDLSADRGVAKGANVLLVVLESTAARYLKPYGAGDDPMPRLTALAARSIVFDSTYAVYPESIKELFATMCSRYPAFGAADQEAAGGSCDSLAGVLHDAGYRTALFHSGRFAYLGMDALVRSLRFDTLADAGAIGGDARSSFGVDESSSVRRMLQWLDTLAPDDRFFLTYVPVAGHHPYVAWHPGPFPVSSEIGRYENSLHEGDEALGELLDGLRARDLERHTLVDVIGDHGEAFGQHAGNTGHTLFVYDENVHVPSVIALPGLAHAVRVPAVTSVLDTAPTLLDLIGVAEPVSYEGTSALRALPRMALFFTDYSRRFAGLRDGCWKDILDLDTGRSKLFDVCRDADETRDLASDHEELVRTYRGRLDRWVGFRPAG